MTNLDTRDETVRRVLIIYTGGTIGMKRTRRGYAPIKGYMEERLKSFQAFQDVDAPPRTTPVSQFGRRIQYDILEYDSLLDSSDMEVRHWNKIAGDIYQHYDAYDGFVVLHGTDTMAFTASALSFILVNLGKPVILTGSQIPLSEVRNDGVNNLLGAMTFAGHYDIPEVCLYFDNLLFRGTRVRKYDSSGLGAFRSSNLPPLAKVGVEIQVSWHLILPMPSRPLVVRPISEQNVAALRLFPGISIDTIERFLQPPLKGLILETYGAGNVPSQRSDFMNVLASATKRGLIIVNCTQCFEGGVHLDYASGAALADIGILTARDMTPEAALTKLAYLLSQEDVNDEIVSELMGKSLRGELTDARASERISTHEQSFVDAVARVLAKGEVFRVNEEVGRVMFPVLMCSAASRGDVEAMERMVLGNANVDVGDYDGRTPLHLAAASGQVEAVQFLLDHGADVTATDRWGRNALQDAIDGRHDAAAALIRRRGGRLSRKDSRLALCLAAEEGDLGTVRRLVDNGVELTVSDFDGRTPLHRAANAGQLQVVSYLIAQGVERNALNRWNETPADEAERSEHAAVVALLNDDGNANPDVD